MTTKDAECIHGWRSKGRSRKGQRNGVSGMEIRAVMDLGMADGSYREFLEQMFAHAEGRGKEGAGKEIFKRALQDVRMSFEEQEDKEREGEEDDDVEREGEDDDVEGEGEEEEEDDDDDDDFEGEEDDDAVVEREDDDVEEAEGEDDEQAAVEEEEEDVQELDSESFWRVKAGDSDPKSLRMVEVVSKDIVETREGQDNDDDEEAFDPEYKLFWDGLKLEGYAYSITIPTQNVNLRVMYENEYDQQPKRKRGRPPKGSKDSRLNQESNCDPQQNRHQHYQLPRQGRETYLAKDGRNSRHLAVVRDAHVVAEGSKRKAHGHSGRKRLRDAPLGAEAYSEFVRRTMIIDDHLVHVSADGKRVRYEESSSDSDVRPSKHARSHADQRAKGPATVPRRKKHKLMSDKAHHKSPSSGNKEWKGDASLPRFQHKAGSSGLKQVRPTTPVARTRIPRSPVQGAYNEPSSPDLQDVGVDSQVKLEKSSPVRNHEQRNVSTKKKLKPTVDTSSSETFRKQVTDILAKPYDQAEYKELFQAAKVRKPILLHKETRTGGHSAPDRRRRGRSYLHFYPALREKIKFVLNNKPKVLMFLRAFFFWLQHKPMEGSFEPWLDKRWLEAMRLASAN